MTVRHSAVIMSVAPFLFQYGQLMGFYTASWGQTA